MSITRVIQWHFGGALVKKRVLINQNKGCSKSKTLVNIILSKKYGPINGFKEVEKRNRRETEPKHKKTRRETEIIKGTHFNLKSVLESFRSVLIFMVK